MPTQWRKAQHDDSSLPFPRDADRDARDRAAKETDSDGFDLAALPESAEQIYEAIDDMSRRIDDLARELGCLGYFKDPDDEGPRAA